MHIARMAWRNVWRNKLRSTAVCGSVFLGLVAGIFSSSLVKGMLEGRFKLFIENEISHLQVHHPQFVESRDIKYSLNPDLFLDSLRGNDKIKAFTLRTLTQATISSSTYTAGVSVLGMNPHLEDMTTRFSRFLIEGACFQNLSSNEIIVGSSLLNKMKVGLGSRIVLSFQNRDNEIVRSLFIVRGVFETYSNRYDNSSVMVEKTYLNELLGLEDEFHELAILVKDEGDIEEVASVLSSVSPKSLVRTWWEISPELILWLDSAGIFSYLFMIVILLGLAFGLLNTLLMVVYERTNELRMLMSLGMHKSKVFLLIVFESLFLATVGTLAGWVGGYLLVKVYANNGIDLSALSDVMRDLGFESVIYPHLDYSFFILLPFIVLLFALLAAIYPAMRAIQLLDIKL